MHARIRHNLFGLIFSLFILACESVGSKKRRDERSAYRKKRKRNRKRGEREAENCLYYVKKKREAAKNTKKKISDMVHWDTKLNWWGVC